MKTKIIEVERPINMSRDDLVSHLKAIGRAIIDDADHLDIDTDRLRMLRLEAEIAPCEQITTVTYKPTVTYKLERTADPRLDLGDAP